VFIKKLMITVWNIKWVINVKNVNKTLRLLLIMINKNVKQLLKLNIAWNITKTI